jgi:hypothetical protein
MKYGFAKAVVIKRELVLQLTKAELAAVRELGVFEGRRRPYKGSTNWWDRLILSKGHATLRDMEIDEFAKMVTRPLTARMVPKQMFAAVVALDDAWCNKDLQLPIIVRTDGREVETEVKRTRVYVVKAVQSRRARVRSQEGCPVARREHQRVRSSQGC